MLDPALSYLCYVRGLYEKFVAYTGRTWRTCTKFGTCLQKPFRRWHAKGGVCHHSSSDAVDLENGEVSHISSRHRYSSWLWLSSATQPLHLIWYPPNSTSSPNKRKIWLEGVSGQRRISRRLADCGEVFSPPIYTLLARRFWITPSPPYEVYWLVLWVRWEIE